jgi:hypothetical protein
MQYAVYERYPGEATSFLETTYGNKREAIRAARQLNTKEGDERTVAVVALDNDEEARFEVNNSTLQVNLSKSVNFLGNRVIYRKSGPRVAVSA